MKLLTDRFAFTMAVHDDYDSIAPCRLYVARLKARGKDVQITEYQNAMHVFNWPGFKKPLKLEKAQNVSNCQLAEAQDGVIVNAKTNRPFTYADPCVKLGATFLYDEEAANEAKKNVSDFVTTSLRPK